MEKYSELVIDHFTNPRNCGSMPDADGIGNAGNPRCGDTMRLYIRVRDGVITESRFKTQGCGAAVAASSMTTVLIQGKTLEDAARLTNRDVVEALGGLPPEKLDCSVLARESVLTALADYYVRKDLPVPGNLQVWAEVR